LTTSPESIRRNETHAAVVEGKPVGFYVLVGEERETELEHPWVLPEFMGTGIERAVRPRRPQGRASLGAEVVRIEGDPNAEGFYRRMGVRRVGEINYPMDGQKRTLPLLVMEIRNHHTA
jgi:hypothetical protein